MSLRNIRKYYGVTGLPPPEDDDEDFEPSYTQRQTKNLYAGLEVEASCSNSEDERNSDEESSDKVVLETTQPEATKKKKNKKKRKQHKQKGKTEDLQEEEELDDIDRSLLEVNAILGAPEDPLENKAQKDIKKIRQNLFTVRQQHFDAENELRRRFGADDEDDKKKRGRQPNLRLIAQKGAIIKTDKVYKKCGLSMTIVKRENDLTYFAFVHNKEYQRLHRTFLVSHNESAQMLPFEESQRRMHVEGLLETADRLYYMEQYSAGNQVIEEIIAYMQQCAHLFFSVTDIRVRLQYKHVENRAFHIALLKYMHMLTNKACHRTALEIGKLLLNLDPSDPLAVLFMIDSIAIRAGEYQWLIEAIEFWSEERDAGFLFNMMYSLALAEFHVARKKKADYEKADSLLIKAMLQFPTVAIQMLKIAGIKNSTINSCPLFNPDNNDRSSVNLKNLIALYAKFIWHKFLEQPVKEWFIRNAVKIAEDFSTDQQMQVRIMEYANRRMNLFQTYPSEIVRHLSILSPLSNLIVDGAVPEVPDFVSCDPEPPLHGVNRYERQSNPDGENGFFQFFTSMMPEHELMDVGRIPDFPSPIRAGSPLPDPAPPLQFRMLPQEFDDVTEDEIRAVNDLALLEAALADDDASEEGVTDAVRYFMNLYDTMFDGRFDVHEGLRQFVNAVNRTSDSEEDSDAYILFTDPQVLDFDSDHDLLNEIQLAASEGSHDLPRESQLLEESIEHTDEPENAHIVHEPQNDLLEDDCGGRAENQTAEKSAQIGHEQRSGLVEENSVEPEKQEPLSVNFIYDEQNGSLQGVSEQEQQQSKVNFVCEKEDSNNDDAEPDKQPQTINFVYEGNNDIDKIDSEALEKQQSINYLVHEDRRYSSEDNLNNIFDGGVTPSKQMKKNEDYYPKANNNLGEEGRFNILSDRDGAVGGDMYSDYKMPGSDNDEHHEDAEESEDDVSDDMNSSDKNSENNGGDGDCDDDDEEGDEDKEGREDEQRKNGDNGDDDDNENDDEEDDEEIDDDIDQGDIDHNSDGLHAMEDLDDINDAEYMNNNGNANDIDQGQIDHNSDGLDAMEDLDDIDDAEYMNNHGNANDMDQGDIDSNSDGFNAMEDLDDIDDAEYMNNHGNANQNEAIAPSRNFMLQRVHTNPRNGYHFNRLQLMLQNGMLPLLLVPRDFDVVGLNVIREPTAPPSDQR